MSRIPPLFAIGIAAIAIGCGAESADLGGRIPEGAGGSGEIPAASPSGGPLAIAGADRLVLPGEKVRLDGRGSSRGESGKAISFLWTQEEGPRVALDDPSATVATFVAPPRTGRDGDRLVFRLRVDDGTRSSLDRVAVEVVDRPEQIEPAPVALGGADQEVLRGARVQLALPSFVDAACLDAPDPQACLSAAMPFCWTQVEGEGERVSLDTPCDGTPSFDAPGSPGVLTFRLDAHRAGDVNRSELCRPDGDPSPERPFCAAPDYVRVFVRERNARTSPPTANIDTTLPGASGPILALEHPAATYPQAVKLYANHRDPSAQQINTFIGWRPLLGDPPFDEEVLARRGTLTAEGMLIALSLEIARTPAWPRTLGVAFEAQYNRVRAAPAAMVIAWRPPVDRPQLVAHADTPCGPGGDEWCAPFQPGDRVTLQGAVQGDPGPDALTSCWEQIAGPPVELEPAGCLPGLLPRSFTAPTAPDGARELALSFRFTADDGGPLSSRPDVVVVRVASEVKTPEVAASAPAELVAGRSALLRATGTGAAMRWRQVWTNDTPSLKTIPQVDCPKGGACVTVQAPPEAVGRTVTFEAIATDAAGATFTRRFVLPVVE